jgi:hypothetical protein
MQNLPAMFDISPLFGHVENARVDNAWECLDVTTIANDKSSLWSFAESGTSLTNLAKNSTMHMHFYQGAAAVTGAGVATHYYGENYVPFRNYITPVSSETLWNQKIDAAMMQMVQGRLYLDWASYHGLLPTIRSLGSPIRRRQRLRRKGNLSQVGYQGPQGAVNSSGQTSTSSSNTSNAGTGSNFGNASGDFTN